MKRFVLVAIALVFVLVGCGDPAEYADRAAVRDQQERYRTTQPVPTFDYSQDLDLFSQIYRLKNEARNTYSVISSEGTGAVQFICPSVGFAIPADTQLTNPLKVADTTGAVLEQAEPNGLYSSKNTDGTYVMCVRKNGDVTPIYTELKVTTFPFAVRVDENGLLVEVEDSPSSMKVELKGR